MHGSELEVRGGDIPIDYNYPRFPQQIVQMIERIGLNYDWVARVKATQHAAPEFEVAITLDNLIHPDVPKHFGGFTMKAGDLKNQRIKKLGRA